MGMPPGTNVGSPTVTARGGPVFRSASRPRTVANEDDKDPKRNPYAHLVAHLALLVSSSAHSAASPSSDQKGGSYDE